MTVLKSLISSLLEAKKSIVEAIQENQTKERIEAFNAKVQEIDFYSLAKSYEIVSEVVGTEIILKDSQNKPLGDKNWVTRTRPEELGWLSRYYRYSLNDEISSDKIRKIGRIWDAFCKEQSNQRFVGLVYQFKYQNGQIVLVFVHAEKEFEKVLKKYFWEGKNKGFIQW